MKWEYKCVDSATPPSVVELNEAGKDGWELCFVWPSGVWNRHVIIYKRPKQDTEK